jgi:dTDP-4-dehydrorhamnose reductase
LELWGGHECTFSRVGDRFRDQTLLTGHQDRLEDLARFADLGIRKLRYPVIWERVAPDHPEIFDWRWSDERLAEIRRLGMEPIVGLLHHGSGPRYTDLVADNFVDLFAAYAGAVAERHPDVLDWTPVNEPLTTARFSALYGVWYPHARDEALFWRALLNQVDGTRAAMAAIRRVNPDARLVQTEDLGHHYSTDELTGVATHLNHRRWMTWDLLAGRVTPDHPMHGHLEGYGLGDRLRAIADNPCPPDVIGVNYYPTSERFLDHRLDAYPYDRPEVGYHDLTALRLLDPPSPGLAGLLRQTWDRYRIPIAVTESHLGCTREEQLRWLWQSWETCRNLAAEGMDLRALTAWALLGNIDWNSLITVEAGHYETGAFDVRGGTPRPTAIARLLKVLGRGEEPSADAFPMLAGHGWWQRPIRLEHAAVPGPGPEVTPCSSPMQPIAIAGTSAILGMALASECELRGLAYLVTEPAAPGFGRNSAAAWLDRHRPWAVIDVAGWTDQGEVAVAAGDNPAHRHVEAILAEACTSRGIRHTTLAAELPIASPTDRLVMQLATKARDAARPSAFSAAGAGIDAASVPDLVRIWLDLLIDGETGNWRVADGVAIPAVSAVRAQAPDRRAPIRAVS